ncbi:MAG: hypothetical protein ACTSRS_19880 [Candidatus Helarchaeota archaeon]
MPRKRKAKKKPTEEEQAEIDAKEQSTDKKAKGKKKEKWEKITRLRIEVDFWRTDLHGKEIGIRQKDQQRAKSRQFSKDMDLYGEVKINKEKAGNIGYRTTEWEDDLSKGQLKRLVIRYFSEKERWLASIEEDTIRGLTLSVSYQRPIPAFRVFHQGNKNVFTFQRIARGTGSMDRAVIPLLLDEDEKKVDFFIFDEKRFTIGSDWKVYRPNEPDKILAEFDSKKFNIGGKVIIDIYDPELAKNKIFVNTMILFGAVLKFWDPLNDYLEDITKKYLKNEISYTPNRFELELLENPRAIKR